ncbi:hypothetical protein [Salsipaludibacter albus]|uniref:hypothetical protein n=1 Tax=Salsipaludibacter albus TaxID=2849650 RepID=UPI001EE4938D|nr:hypothetical protein [Salsipaludibacter albus]MBY5163269.1 hypothetical protein [Salsipaludibacter albus]
MARSTRSTSTKKAGSSTKATSRPRRPWWRARLPLWSLLAAVAVGALVTWLLMRPTGIEARVAELEAEQAANDATATQELLAAADESAPRMQAVLDEMAPTLPQVADGPLGPAPDDSATTAPEAAPATEEDIQSWRDEVASIRDRMASIGSAGNEVNIGRTALVSAVDQLGDAVELYAVALTLDEDQAAAVLSRVAAARINVVETWVSGAIQVDMLAIDTGNGHLHVSLSAVPGQEPPDDGGEG